MRMIYQTTINPRTAKVYRDTINDEYIVKLYLNNKLQKEASYYTDDKMDAVNTAEVMIKPKGANDV